MFQFRNASNFIPGKRTISFLTGNWEFIIPSLELVLRRLAAIKCLSHFENRIPMNPMLGASGKC